MAVCVKYNVCITNTLNTSSTVSRFTEPYHQTPVRRLNLFLKHKLSRTNHADSQTQHFYFYRKKKDPYGSYDSYYLSTRIITSNSHLAPFKTVSFPRLELVGAMALQSVVDEIQDKSNLSKWVSVRQTMPRELLCERLPRVRSNGTKPTFYAGLPFWQTVTWSSNLAQINVQTE